MFKNFYTTQMSRNSKILQVRFAKMRSESSRFSKLMAMTASILLLVMMTCVTVALAAVDGLETASYDIQVTNNGKIIKFTNKPFVENDTVYLPLREMLNNENVANDDITYDNGYVEFLIYTDAGVVYRGVKYDYCINRVQIGSPYAYIAGHSHGSTENAAILREPILKNNTTYVPYDLFEKLKESNQGIFEDITVTAKDKTGGSDILSGVLYWNEELNFQLEIPLDWCGKYQVETDGNFVHFIHLATYSKYGEGTGELFQIRRLSNTNEFIDSQKLLAQTYEYAYFLTRPTDIQYPVWADRDEEDIAIADEYEKMSAQIEFIENSFDRIVKSSNDDSSIVNAEGLTLSDLYQLQEDVDNGHYPWRLDPIQVVNEYFHNQDMGGGEITSFAGDSLKCSATYTINGTNYLADLFKPIQKDEQGIWIVRYLDSENGQ